MKKILILTLTLVFIFSIPLNIHAVAVDTVQYEYDDVTIIFQSDTPFSTEKQLHFIELLTLEAPLDEGTPYNLLCSIFGHKYVVDNIIKITHKVSDSELRCLKEIYEIGECSRCGDTYANVMNSYYINCCE